MADFNGVGNPQLANGIGRLFGVDYPSLPVIGSEIQIVTSPWERPEFWALLGGSLGWGGAGLTAAAVAGQRSMVQLLNPTGSGVLLIVEKVAMTPNVAGQLCFICISQDVLANSSGAWVNRDLRRASTTGGAGALAGRMRQAASAAFTGSVVWPIQPAGGETVVQDVDVVLPPGWSVMVRGSVDNIAVTAAFMGRERAAPGPEIGAL